MARRGREAPPQQGGARRYPQAPAAPPLPPRPFCSSPASRVHARLSSCSRWPGPCRASSVSTAAALGVWGVPQAASLGLCPPLCRLSLRPRLSVRPVRVVWAPQGLRVGSGVFRFPLFKISFSLCLSPSCFLTQDSFPWCFLSLVCKSTFWPGNLRCAEVVNAQPLNSRLKLPLQWCRPCSVCSSGPRVLRCGHLK